MARATRDLYDYLLDLLQNRPEYVLSLQVQVAQVRCWFDYFGLEQDPLICSPYAAILQGLATRKASMPRPLQPFATHAVVGT
mmetsp:Transcript_119715/g.382109  ORF Transcript_119715/g.382109 Transcript_119715/m.382109 type:complete len:82 (+) Transcript_119715:135-380(+)